jgi:signal transduction histidine kinase
MALESADFGLRELMAVREIAQAFLTAERPGDVYQFALDRVTPLVGATFACVYLLDGTSDVMRLQAVHNWPQRYVRFLGEMRVRFGAGPSGLAASERRVFEIPDVFADASLEDWWEVANELGFRSLMALPLQTAAGVLGTVTFYFAGTGGSATSDKRDLLRVVADQMAATAEKARLFDDLRRTNQALQTTNAELERQYAAVVEARRLQDEFLANISHELRTPLTAVMGYIALMEEGVAGPVTTEQHQTLGQVKSASEKLLELIGDLLDLTSLKKSALALRLAEFDPREPLRIAVATIEGRRDTVMLALDDSGALPVMRSDRGKLTRLVGILLRNAYKFTEAGEVRVGVDVKGDRVRYRVADTGIGISQEAQGFVFDEFRQEDGSATRRFGGSGLGLAIARQLARLLGGEVTVSSERGKGSTFTVDLPNRI